MTKSTYLLRNISEVKLEEQTKKQTTPLRDSNGRILLKMRSLKMEEEAIETLAQFTKLAKRKN